MFGSRRKNRRIAFLVVLFAACTLLFGGIAIASGGAAPAAGHGEGRSADLFDLLYCPSCIRHLYCCFRPGHLVTLPNSLRNPIQYLRVHDAAGAVRVHDDSRHYGSVLEADLFEDPRRIARSCRPGDRPVHRSLYDRLQADPGHGLPGGTHPPTMD